VALLAVVGPTGTGKSDLGIAVASHLIASGQPAEIINIDSMQFYRGMDIGTAKLTLAERQGITHHLFDYLDVTEESTAAQYQEIARPLIEDLQAQGTVPILVGGSMLYIASVLNDFEFPGTDPVLRAELEAELELVGPIALHRRLAKLDPIAASRIIPQNGRRTVRAIEIITITGKPFAAALPDVPVEWQSSLQIGLNGPREDLIPRLELRVKSMWDKGLVQEVEGLTANGLREAKTAKRAIGYAQALAQLDGEISQDEAIGDTIRLTQKYARRQMSWFRRDARINWLDYRSGDKVREAISLVEGHLAQSK